MNVDGVDDDEPVCTSSSEVDATINSYSGVDADAETTRLIPEATKANERDDESVAPRQTRKRHGANNQHKMKHLVKWLHETFFDNMPGIQHRILDVAGGKGELAARLTMCHGMSVTLVDPRPADIASVYVKDVVPRLPSKWQERLKERCKDNPSVVEDTVQERFQQLIMYFTDETVLHEPKLVSAVEDCTILIGIHADSATECIVDVALRWNKPFVVIPCCVFPNLFRQRFVDENGSKVPVRTCEQFCRYLAKKDARCCTSTLPFDGRNVAIWWDGRRDPSRSYDGNTSSFDDSTVTRAADW